MRAKIIAMYFMMKFTICDLLSIEERRDLDDINKLLMESQFRVLKDLYENEQAKFNTCMQDQIDFWQSKLKELNKDKE